MSIWADLFRTAFREFIVDGVPDSGPKRPDKEDIEDAVDALETAIDAMLASTFGVAYKGMWNATTNSPAIPAAAPANQGWFYRVSVAGTTSIDGIAVWAVGDIIQSNGTIWQKQANEDSVTSVIGLTGAVPAASGAETLARSSNVTIVTPLGLDSALDPIDAAVATIVDIYTPSLLSSLLSRNAFDVWSYDDDVAAHGTYDLSLREGAGYEMTSALVDSIRDLSLNSATLTASGVKAPIATVHGHEAIQFDGSTTVYYQSPDGAAVATDILDDSGRPFSIGTFSETPSAVTQTLFAFDNTTTAAYLRLDLSSNGTTISLLSSFGISVNIGGAAAGGQSLADVLGLMIYIDPDDQTQNIALNQGIVVVRDFSPGTP